MRTARRAGYVGDVFIQSTPIRKPWSLKHVPYNYLRYLVEFPSGSASYDRVVYADADCWIMKDPSSLVEMGENRFANDLELFKAGHPCVREFTSMLSAATIEKHANDHIINAGFFSVTGHDHGILCEAVLDLARPEYANPHDQTLLNKVLWEEPPFVWSTFPDETVVYGAIGEQQHPNAAVVHYIGKRHGSLDERIRTQFPDMVGRMEACMAE